MRDNPSLTAASKSQNLLLVYPLHEDYIEASEFRKIFILESLYNLNKDLQEYNQQLFITNDLSTDLDYLKTKGLDKVYYSQSYNSKDIAYEEELKSNHPEIKFVGSYNSCLIDINDSPFTIEEMPDVFTKFRNKVEKLDLSNIYLTAAPTTLPKFKTKYNFIEFDHFYKEERSKYKKNTDFTGGELFAKKRLDHYLWQSDAVATYKETRNGMLKFDDSTKFSPWLSIGNISPKEIYLEVLKYENQITKNESTYWIFFELLWRDYFKYLSLKYKDKIFKVSGIKNINNKTANNDNSLFNSWATASCESDFVNANMIELNSSGWMSNRGRQNVASYLAKTLQVDWTLGADYFAKNLIDYDVESNWGNWLYLAGVGTDPRDRIFNVDKQAEHYDSDGSYRKKFLKHK